MKNSKKFELFTFNKAMLLILIIMVIVILKTSFTPPETLSQLRHMKTNLELEAEIVLDALSNGNSKISFMSKDSLVENKIIKFSRLEYSEMKQLFGIKSDFCVFFEDVTGNIVKIDNIKSGIGSDKISINGEPCS